MTDTGADTVSSFRLVQSGNSITVSTAGNNIIINALTGNLSGKQDSISIPLIIGSGGTGIVTAGSATALVGMNSSGAVYDYYLLAGSNNTSVVRSGTSYVFSTLTNNIAGKQDLIAIPLIVSSGGTGTTASGSATTLVGMNSSGVVYDYFLLVGSNSTTVTRSGTSYVISTVTSGAAAGGGNGVVNPGSAGNLAYYVSAGTAVDDLIIGSANTILGVNSSGAVNEYKTLVAGNNITFSYVTTGIQISASTGVVGVVYAATGNTYIVTDLASDLTNEFRLVQSGNSITISTAGNNIVINALTGNLSGKQDLISIPLITSSGGTGRTTVGSAHTVLGVNSDGTTLSYYALLASDNVTIVKSGTGIFFSANTGSGSGGSGASTANTYIVTDFSTDLSNEFRLVQSGNSITISTAGNLIIINAVTNAAGAGGTQTIRIPMAILTVKINSANAFYTAKSGTQMDAAHVQFVDSGLGIATYWCKVPNNVNTTENWNLFFDHEPDTGAGGNVAVTLCAQVLSDGSVLDANTTVLLSARSFPTYASGTLAVTSAATGVMDNTMGLAANNTFYVAFQRLGNNAGDTVNANWNLKNLSVQMDVNS